MSSIIQVKSADTIKNISKRYKQIESLIEGETEAFHELPIRQEADVPSISDSYKDAQLKIRWLYKGPQLSCGSSLIQKGKIKQMHNRNVKKLIFQKISAENETFLSIGAYYMMTAIQKTRTNQKCEKCNLFVMV